MCERFAIPDQGAAEKELAPDTRWWQFKARFNVGGGQYVPVVRVHQEQSEGVMMQWGLIPAWAEGKLDTEAPRRIASELIERSPMHREPWMKGQRCILPLSGFYVWALTAARYRQPYFVRLIDRPAFGLAGVWDRSEIDHDDVIESFSLISVPPNELLQRIGSTGHAMPAILQREDYETWLRGTPIEARSALRSCESSWLRAVPVSPRINSLKFDDEALTRPIEIRALTEA
jgi:putative SOS response-associated peptidase YedK